MVETGIDILSNDLDDEIVNKIIKYECRHKKEKWKGKIAEVEEYHGYIGFVIEGRGSRLQAYVGESKYERWICFPIQKKSTTLSSTQDLFWNIEELQGLFENIVDAITVAYGIKELGAIKII